MSPLPERELNQAAYRELKETIKQRFPLGRFVAISSGQIVADAEGVLELCALLRAMGKDPMTALAVEAGVDYPETAIILLAGLAA